MGANAVTTVPVYTAGEVLTAADLNITNSGIPVFATSVTRDAAFGGAGEKTLAEGQFAYIEATNTTQYYDGAAWRGLGTLVQSVNSQTGAVATGTTILPFDNTIPQNTEGTEFLSVAITPTSATNILEVTVVLNYSYSIANTVSMALFQDSTANALAASAEYGSTATGMVNSSMIHRFTAGTTSATTLKVRAGGETAGTITVNGISGTRFFGGVMSSSITVVEYTA